MMVAIPATSRMEIRLNVMLHRWRQSSDGFDLRQAAVLTCPAAFLAHSR